jgi:hypothetical protein
VVAKNSPILLTVNKLDQMWTWKMRCKQTVDTIFNKFSMGRNDKLIPFTNVSIVDKKLLLTNTSAENQED